MGNKLVPKIILEGTRLMFKTDTAFARLPPSFPRLATIAVAPHEVP